MIDTKEALWAFKDKIDSMSQDERRKYFKEMGFVFEPNVSKKNESVKKKIQDSPKNSDRRVFFGKKPPAKKAF